MRIGSHVGTPRLRPGRALLMMAVGASFIATSAVVAWREPAADFGAPVIAAVPSAPVAERVRITDGGLPSPVAADAPTRLRIPALRQDAAVEASGIDPRTGDFRVPPSVDRVGWYRFGPGFSASSGSIVIAGHVDSAAGGEGAFFRLGSLEAGDAVTLTGPKGLTRTFRVVAREHYRKTAIPLDKYFTRAGATRLTLITCGGPFDAATRHYRDNVVVTAIPRS